VKKVGIIGCGAIGSLIAEAVEKRIVECDELVLFDRSADRAEKLKASLHVPAGVVGSVDEMIALKPAVVVEAASQ
jgi:aspartate dehydrogenase